MSGDFGITSGLVEREDLSVYMKRAKQERARAVAELFGFGFAVAKDAVESVAARVRTVDVSAAGVHGSGR